MYIPLHSHRRAQVMMVFTAIVLALAAVAIAVKALFSVRSPHGSPVGLSLRAGNRIVTLIQTLEPYLVTLHRDPAKDRYRVGVFLQSLDGTQPGRLIPIGGGYRTGQLGLIRLLGFDGRTVWFYVASLGGVNVESGKLITAADLQRANPTLGDGWNDPSRIAFGNRLELFTPDRQSLLEIDPETWKTVAAPPGRKPTLVPLDPKPESFLTPFAFPSPTEWLGLLTPREAERSYKVGSWIRDGTLASDAKVIRQLYKGRLGPAPMRSDHEILSSAPAGTTEFLNGAFMCATPGGDPVRVSGPDGFLVVSTSEPGLQGTLVLTRVNTAGEIAWKVDTGLDPFLLRQILPGSQSVALIGTRRPVPDKVSEPLLMVVETASGSASTTSLWR